MKHLILCCAFLAIASCKKNTPAAPAAPQLPAATQTGANTFGCMIDGRPYIITGRSNSLNGNGISVGSYILSNRLAVDAVSVAINCTWNGVLGTYKMANKYPYFGYYWDRSNGTAVTGSSEYKTDSINNGAVTITFYNGTIISGTFWFDGANDSGKIVHVTDGRFDITL